MDLTNPAPLSVPTLVFNLILGLGLSLFLAWYYVKFGQSLSNRTKFSQNIPLLTMITLLVISIVKSSLALSLGLVGALSIVRFRTAIKDPEELIYLFFAIAIGLGMGADQRIPTLAVFVLIMGYLFIRHLILGGVRNPSGNSLYLNLSMPKNQKSVEEVFDQINFMLIENFGEIELRRMDVNDLEILFIFYIKANEAVQLMKFSSSVQEEFPKIEISVVEQQNFIG